MKAQYTCFYCGHKFESVWTDEAALLAVDCVLCGGMAVAGRGQAEEDGALIVKDEKPLD